MHIVMIRHGATKGNSEGRYVGRTDESLTKETRALLTGRSDYYRQLVSEESCCEKYALEENNFSGKADLSKPVFYCSPYIRCIETLNILFPNSQKNIVADFRECDFGEFEYKNYKELNGNPYYQRYIDSGGEEPFPGGESKRGFQNRCVAAFGNIVENEMAKATKWLVLVVHGGTIMSILDYYSRPHKDYFDWQVANGEGYMAELDVSGVDACENDAFVLADITRLKFD